MKKIMLILGCVAWSFQAVAQQNTLILIADDFGLDYCGFYPNNVDTAKMPNVRQLAARGVRFDQFCTTPYCSPSRASLATGRFPFRHGVGTVIGGTNSAQLDTSELTLARLLRYYAPTRYATAQVGKWHLNAGTPQSLNYPTQVFGYNFFAGNFQGAITDYFNWTKVKNGVTFNISNYATTETINDAISWLDTLSSNKPFFLWVGFNAPHSPYHKPPDSLHSVAGLTGTTQHINQNPKLYYKAMTESMDSEIGRLLRRLAALGRLDSTNIIFLGDNGNTAQITQSSATTHVKGTLYEGGIHTPLVIAGPAVSGSNWTSNALVNGVDLFATVLEWSGFSNWQSVMPSNKRVDGKSLMPLLRQQQRADVRDWNFTEIFTPTPTANDGKMIKNLIYKLIRFDSGPQQFFNLMNDPNENVNLLSLARPLNSTELTNYNFLCNELANLIGTNDCLNVGTDETTPLPCRVYPSFFENWLKIETESPLDYQLTDVHGRVIRQGQMAHTHTWNTAELTKGFYWLRVWQGEKVKVFKLAKNTP